MVAAFGGKRGLMVVGFDVDGVRIMDELVGGELAIGNKMHKAFPLPVIEFSLPEEVPTASEESSHCQKKREATAVKIALLLKSRRNCQSKSDDSYTKLVPHVTPCTNTTDTTSDATGKKKGMTVTLTTEDMQKRKNDVKARTTLLLSLPDENQLRSSKYKTAQELWAAILKTFDGNEATKKTKKNLLKQQYGNFKAEGSETLEQTFNRQQVIVGQLQFMDVEIEHDDLNQKFLTSLAPEWLMHTIVWRNRSDLDTMSLDDLYNHLKVYESEVQKKSQPNPQNMDLSLQRNIAGEMKMLTLLIDENDMEEMDIKWNMALLRMRADRAPRSQDRGRKDNYRQGSKVEEKSPKALMAIDGVGWDWSYMAYDEENHALVANKEAPSEFSLMANTSAESKVFNNSLCSKDWLAQVESRLVEHKDREIKYCEKIKGLEYKTKSSDDYIEILKKELELIKKEKEGLDGKLAGFQTASKDLDNLLESQRLEKNKEGLGYSVVPPPPAQIYSSPKTDLSWTGLLEFKDDTVTDYSRPAPTRESFLDDAQNGNPSVTEEASPSNISPKSFIKFVKANESPTKSKIDKAEKAKKSPVKYAEQYRKPIKKPNVRGNQRNWNNLKSHQLGPNFVMKKNACFNCGDFNHLAYDCKKRVKKRTYRSHNTPHKSFTSRPVAHKPYRPPMRPVNSAWPNRTSFNKPAHSYTNRPFQRTSAVRSQYKVPWVPTVNRNIPLINKKVSTVSRKFSTINRKFPTANRKFPTGGTKFFTADMRKKQKAVKPSACNISYLSDYEPFDEGCVSFGQGGCKITGKGTIKTGKLEFENVYFVKDLKYNMFSMSQICDNKNSVLFTDSECIVLGQNFKLSDDDNVLLRTPRQHNMYSIDLNNIVPHKDLTCLVAKASADECMLWHRRLGHLNVKTMNKLVRHNLVRGLPTKCFENDHTCTACLKGKQHKASLTDDFSRFTWTFFLKTKDETSGILKKFITEIENLKELKVKIIRCDNVGEFRNKEINDFCSQKGIKREFRNARTPQQNGVAERRNRTLIEAARTMVLVNKSQNMTPYELFNGRTPAIGFLKPFGCHVMILNTLDNLGKFETKGDEGYFIGYSMSSKAFRVFNKRNRRVEENLHVEFLENKAIEKGVGLNWLFDIDSFTKSMNYVSVDAGTNSTNLSGTKDAASHEVKKDVSSLRYIALPNWVHDALLESSSSKPQDDCSTDVEFPIPTVSSPVPTACLNDSPKPLIDSDGVEADVSNMETTITASPTPTLRIHKDHPKSQIIGPVDTPIQTKNKSKEEEGIDYDEVFAPVARIEAIRLFLAYASFIGFTVYQMDVKSAFLYGTIDEEVHQVTPKECHLRAVKRIFRYLKGHPKLGLWYPKESPFDLTIVATSTTEAGYVAAASCRGQVLWIQNQLLDYGQCKLFPLLGKLSTVSVFLGFGLTFAGTSKQWGVLRILMISPRLIPLVSKGYVPMKFWPTARIETTEEGTKILATIDGIHRIVTESSLRRNLKLQDKEGIRFNKFSSNIATALVCLATNMTYNSSKMIFDGLVKNVNNKGEGSGTPTEPHHTPSHEAQQTSHTTPSSPTLPHVTPASIPTVTPSETTPLRQYTRRARITQSSALPPVAYEPASPLRDVSEGEACPTDFGFEVDQDRANIVKTSTLPHDSVPRVTSPAADEGGRNLDEGEEVAERVSDDTEEMATVPTSMDAATVLASEAADIPTGSGSIPTDGSPAAEVPTGSDVVPTSSSVFSTTTVVTPYTRRKGKETMIMIDGLDRSNETVAKYLQEYHQFATELPLERRIELISDLARYHENYAKVHKFQTQQKKPWSKKQKRDYYMAVIKSNLGWKVKDFRGISFEELEAKFTAFWKQVKDFIPMGSKEEAERFKRKGVRFEQESVKKLKTSEEVPEEVKTPDEVLDEKVHIEGQRSYWTIIRLGGSSASYQFFVDLLKHMDREDLNQLWVLVKELLSNRPPTSNKEMELWVELKRLYEPDDEDRLEGLPSEEGSDNSDDLLQASSEELLTDGK
nr:hypothetical protein [Tanacetum cinerariifolium]